MINARGFVVLVMAALLCVAAAASHAEEPITPRHQRPTKITCTVVRDFVAMVGEVEAERLARASGASEERLAAAKACLKNQAQ